MKIFHWSLLAGLVLSSCANIVTPTGGPKDITPPKIVQSTPENLSTHFKGNKVTVLFDEYVKLDNPSQEIIISPTIQPEPKIQVKGKKLEIDFKDAKLDSNTTYTINFGGSLKDVNESNVLNNFQYVFSTGDVLDSLYISGKLLQAQDDKPAGKVLVMLYKESGDSVLLKKRPYYFTKTADDGSFQFNHVSGGSFQIFALKDENFNYTYDLPNEELAFNDTPLTVDTNVTGISLRLFQEEKVTRFQRIGMEDSKQGFFKLIYSLGVDSMNINAFEDNAPVAIPEFNKTRDTIIAWYIRSIDSDSLKLILNKDSVEKVIVRNIPHREDSLKRIFPKFSLAAKDSLIPTKGFISSVLNHPAKTIALDRVGVVQDSTNEVVQPVQIRFMEGSKRHIQLDFLRKPGTNYSILFPAGVLTDYFGSKNDSIVWKVKTKTDEDYGSLDLAITGTEGQHYILQMVDFKNDNKIKEQAFTGSTKMEFNKLIPGSYEIRIIYDANANGKWDTGNLLQHRQPEKTYTHPERINVRANWELEVELKL